MMKQKIQITIPEPCQEGWQNMTPVEKGRFCASCQKTVLDFTHLSDNEIIKLVSKNDTLCGRINVSQLNRNLIETKRTSNYFGYFATSVFAFLGLGTQSSVAQEKPVTEQTDLKYLNKTSDSIGTFEVKGTVFFEGKPLQNTTIRNNYSSISTLSDENGKFSIIVKNGDTLDFSFLGMEIQERVVKENKLINIALNRFDDEIIMETSVTGYIIEKRTFFGRIFRKIGNWFR
jgi:hypothetical protein